MTTSMLAAREMTDPKDLVITDRPAFVVTDATSLELVVWALRTCGGVSLHPYAREGIRTEFGANLFALMHLRHLRRATTGNTIEKEPSCEPVPRHLDDVDCALCKHFALALFCLPPAP